MMKKYMTMGALAKSRKPEGDPAGMAATPIPGRRRSYQFMMDSSPTSPGVSSNL
jgi:hypothetical protein